MRIGFPFAEIVRNRGLQARAQQAFCRANALVLGLRHHRHPRLCYRHLLGIREPDQLRFHPLRGAIFESWVVSALYKATVHNALQPRLFHYREARGPEVDFIIDQGQNLMAVEVKSGATVTRNFLKNLTGFSDRMALTGRPCSVQPHVVFGGEDSQNRSNGPVLSWRRLHRIFS